MHCTVQAPFIHTLLGLSLLYPPPHTPHQLCHDVQVDTNEMVIQTLQDVRSLASKMYPSASSSSFDNVVLTGGVALNSVTNGILKSGGGPFRRIYIPPFVGDEGVAFGAAVKCAMEGCKGDESKKRIVKGMLEDFEPYTGTVYGEEDIRDAIEGFEGSIRVERYEGREEKLLECVAGRIAKGEVVAWYQGR